MLIFYVINLHLTLFKYAFTYIKITSVNLKKQQQQNTVEFN